MDVVRKTHLCVKHQLLQLHRRRNSAEPNHSPQISNLPPNMAPSIPSKQMAMVIEKTGGPVEYKEIPVQQPGPDEVLVNIKYSGVCHTDLHAVNGDWPLPTNLPLVGGHEGAGVVVAKGDQVTDIEIGDHAGVKWINGSCLACDFCQQSGMLAQYSLPFFIANHRRTDQQSRRASLRQSPSLRLHRRRYLPAILHRQGRSRRPPPQRHSPRRSRTRPLRRYHSLQGSEGVER